MTRPNPHDAGFKAFFSDPRVAGEAIRRVLPADVAAAIDWPALEGVPTESVGDDLTDRRADLIFKAPLAGRSAFIFLLFEHQSSVDPLMPYRVLVYTVRTWRQWLRENPGARRLPAILPVVMYHGRRSWSGPTGMHDLLDLPDDLRASLAPHLLSFEMVLDDLTRTTDEAIEASTRRALATAALMLLKHVAYDREPVSDRLLGHLEAALRDGEVQAVVSALHYVYTVSDVPRGYVEERLIAGTNDPETREAIMTTAERLRAEGRAEERAHFLERLMQLKFGPLSDETRARIAAADLEALQVYADRVLTAPDPSAVFGWTPP